MNFRRIVMVSGSNLLKRVCTTVAAPASGSVENSHLWKRACTTIAAPSVTNDGSSASAEKAKVVAREKRKKRKMFMELRIRTETGETVNKTLNAFIKREEEDGVSITQENINTLARYIFEWMEKKKMTIPPSELATYLGLIDKSKGVSAALAFFKRVDPDFDSSDRYAKNWPAYLKLAQCMRDGWNNRSRGGHSSTPAVLLTPTNPSKRTTFATDGDGLGRGIVME